MANRPLPNRALLCGVLALALAGCGGGDGGGAGSVASIPTPPPSPTPTPTTVSVSAPAAATLGGSAPGPVATDGGVTIAAPGSSVLPLLETVYRRTTNSSAADSASTSAGATVTLSPGGGQATFNIANPAIGISSTVLTKDAGTTDVYFGTIAGNQINLHLTSTIPGGVLTWTAFGSWGLYANGVNPAFTGTEGMFATGLRTPASAIQASGSAIYRGRAIGEVVFPTSATTTGLTNVDGDATLTANFATLGLTGTLTNMAIHPFEGPPLPWNSVSLSAAITPGQGSFAGTTAVTSVPSGEFVLSAAATGTITGAFYGPLANELGAVWTLFDGVRAAVGSIGATGASNTVIAACSGAGAGCWDY